VDQIPLQAWIVLSTANILGYTATYGSIGSLSSIPSDNADGLHQRLTNVQREKANSVHCVGVFAISCTLFGVVLLTIAIGLTWFLNQEMEDL
jgi:hypothetical protein